MGNNDNSNLEYFVDVLIKMVETSDNNHTQRIKEIKEVIEQRLSDLSLSHTKDIDEIKIVLSKHGQQIDGIKGELGTNAITVAVSKTKASTRSKLAIAATTLMVAFTPIALKFNAQLGAFISKLIKIFTTP